MPVLPFGAEIIVADDEVQAKPELSSMRCPDSDPARTCCYDRRYPRHCVAGLL